MHVRKENPIFVGLLYLTLISGISPLYNVFSGFEHTPYGLLLILAHGRVNTVATYLFILMIFLFLGSIQYFGTGLSLDAIAGLIQMLNFTAPLFFIRGNEELISRVSKRVFWIYILVGVLQLLHLMVPFQPFFELLIPRFYGAPIGGYRGVTMLETEPARAGFQLLMLYVISMASPPKRHVLMTLVLIVAQILMISSTTGILLTIIYFLIKYTPRIIKNPRYVISFGFFGVCIFYAVSSHPKIDLLIQFYKSHGINGVYSGLSAVSGGRFLGTMTSVAEIIDWPFGHGANPDFIFGEKVETEDQSVAGYSTRISARPISALLNYLYYFGVFMLYPLWLAIRRNVPRPRFRMQTWALLVIGILYTPPGNEAWLMAICASMKWPPRTGQGA